MGKTDGLSDSCAENPCPATKQMLETGLKCWIPVVKLLLTSKQRQRRLCWAREKKDWTVPQLSKVLFFDESKFCISFGNKGPRVWRMAREAQNRRCMESSVRFPQSVITWGSMSAATRTALHACFRDQLYRHADFIFPQDLALAHSAKSTKSWVNSHGIAVLDWPANSPHLNGLPRESWTGTDQTIKRSSRARLKHVGLP